MSAALKPKIILVMGSVRAGRRCPQIADWVRGIAVSSGKLDLETIDLRDWPLPPDDERDIPASGSYACAHTRAWSAKVMEADGVVIVTPQYNWGYPAPLKNALDHLFKEWNGKPLAIVTYGGHGGGKCALQLRQVAEGLKMRPTATTPAIVLARNAIEENAPQSAEELRPFEADVARALDELNCMLAPGA